MAQKRRCPSCGSKQWRKEPLSGLVVCSEGHVLQNYRKETNEVDHQVTHTMHKRKLKSTTERKEQKSNANPRLYHGARGRYHYFSCQQLILRMQVEAITTLWDLPPEFEVICRDLWSLHLSLLSEPPPLGDFQGQEDDNTTADFGKREVDATTKPSKQPPTVEWASGSPLFNHEEQADIGESEKSDSEYDSEMEDLLRQNSEISDSSDGGSDDGARTSSRARMDARRRSNTARVSESLTSTLAVIMIALWQLRIPVMYRDLARIVASYELPYLDPIRLLPSDMVLHLTKHNVRALSPYRAPGTLSVHRLTSRLAKRLNASYGIFTPECNAAPLLWRLTKNMGGTPTLYTLAKQVAHILKLPLTLHFTLAPGLKQIRMGDPERHKYDNVPPEVALVATIIIIVKMTYGLDGKPRIPENMGDPVLALPRIDEWVELLGELNHFDARHRDALFSAENALAIGDIDGDLLDDYLDWCQHALLGPESSDIVLKNHFPIGRQTRAVHRVEAGSSCSGLPTGVLVEGLEGGAVKILRPAEDYAIWNSRDVFGTLAEDYETVLGRAAKWIRTGQEYLGGVVELYERRFVRWWGNEKRQEREEGGGGKESILKAK